MGNSHMRKLVRRPSQRLSRSMLWRAWGQVAFVASPPGNGFDCHRTRDTGLEGKKGLNPFSLLELQVTKFRR